MPKQWPPRPAEDFRIATVQWQLDSEARHREAGFDPVSADVVRRRFWQLLAFLQAHGLTTHNLAASLDDVQPGTGLRNHDLTAQGYAFVQRYGDRWVGRMHKDTGPGKEARFLSKWYAELLAR